MTPVQEQGPAKSTDRDLPEGGPTIRLSEDHQIPENRRRKTLERSLRIADRD